MTERRTEPRLGIILPALCWGRGRPDFYAITVDVSPHGLRLRSAVVPLMHEELTCNIRHIGPLAARVVRVADQEFAVQVNNGRPPAGAIARRLMELAKQQAQPLEPTRAHLRIVPHERVVQVTLADGETVPGHVVNVSASGVALLLDRQPAVGATIVVGSTYAKVVRGFPNGVGAAFLAPLDPATVSEGLIL